MIYHNVLDQEDNTIFDLMNQYEINTKIIKQKSIKQIEKEISSQCLV